MDGVARLQQIVVDSRHPASLARFWSEVLDDFEIRPYDDREIRRLMSLGLTPQDDPTVMLDGPGIEICFQLEVDLAASPKRSMHWDLVSTERHAEVERFAHAGAEIVAEFERHVWLRDPEGNDFCVVDSSDPRRLEQSEHES